MLERVNRRELSTQDYMHYQSRRTHRAKTSIIRDCQVLLHMVGSTEPFGSIAIDARTERLAYVRQAIERHFKEIMSLTEYVFLSKDGVEIQRSQESDMLVWSQIFEKVCHHIII